MDETKIVAILSALAQGVNPFTGEVFAVDSPYQHADVVRALHAALDRFRQTGPAHTLDQALNQTPNQTLDQAPSPTPKSRARPDVPSNVGKPWSEAEDRRLLAEFDRGSKPSELARQLGRTLAGIEARLEKHGRLTAGERKTANRYSRDTASTDRAAG